MAWDAAEWVLQRVCDQFLHRWDRAVEKGEPPPDAFVLWELIERRRLHPPGLGLALEYVSRCLNISHKRPEQAPLMANLMLRRFR